MQICVPIVIIYVCLTPVYMYIEATGSKSEKSATDENKKATKLYNKPINAKAEEAAERMAAINKKYLIVEEGKIVVTSAVDSKHLPKF